MRLNSINYKAFSIPLAIPFQNSSQVFTQKTIFIITITDEFGYTGIGECSPLAGVSIETVKEAEDNLNDIKQKIINISLSEELDELSFQLLSFGMLPSVRFAFEQAILNLAAVRDINFVGNNFQINDKLIQVNAVIGFGDLENVLLQIENKIAEGFSVLKIKVGREDPYDDLKLLDSIRTKYGTDVTLRLDANQKWSSDEAIEYIEGLSCFGIEYIEEPCQYACSLYRVAENSKIPIALDESINTLENAQVAIQELKADYFVIKPMVLGSIFSIIDLIHTAERNNRKIIISSSFESSIGKSALVFLAANTSHGLAHGLDSTGFFKNDIYHDYFKAKRGNVLFTMKNYPPKYELSVND